MTALEIEINTNKRELEDTEDQIEEGVNGLKKRLRAMYLAGSDSYTTIIMESESFYDVLMRLELIKRVARHDNTIIDNLYELKGQYESKEAELNAKQEEYDKQYAEYEKEKAELDELYASSEDTLAELEEKQAELKEQNEAYEAEKAQFESSLSGILKSSTGTSARDDEIKATMALADVQLEKLTASIKERLENGEELGEYESSYSFAWPVPGNYRISSGVGARWGSYHTGLDIPGAHGTAIHASESGTVLRINTTCTHDYGKTSSCGCGGGYGNYVIISHGNNFITLYGHMTEVDVQVGDEVKEGDIIGKMGSTGYSTGDHLHFEIRYQGYVLNPAYYVNVN
jgi:murein DD-endopeptidase MepM/ murein hydrolase activator NlpD